MNFFEFIGILVVLIAAVAAVIFLAFKAYEAWDNRLTMKDIEHEFDKLRAFEKDIEDAFKWMTQHRASIEYLKNLDLDRIKKIRADREALRQRLAKDFKVITDPQQVPDSYLEEEFVQLRAKLSKYDTSFDEFFSDKPKP